MRDTTRYYCEVLVILLIFSGCATTTPMQKLQEAAKTNNAELARSAIAGGANMEEALCNAVEENSISIVEFLLNNGASTSFCMMDYNLDEVYIVDPKTKTEYKITVKESRGELTIAASAPQDDDSITNIQKPYFKYNFVFNIGPTPLHYAISSGNVQIAEILLNRGANAKEKYTSKALHFPGPFDNPGLFDIARLASRREEINLQLDDAWFTIKVDGYVYSNRLPTPAVETTALQEAETKGNADMIRLIKARLEQ